MFALTFNTPHNCSNNYIVRDYDANGNIVEKNYCYEHKDIITYDHVCSDRVHDYEIQTYGINTTSARYYHKAICHCKRVIDQAHTVNSNGFCSVCNQHVNHDDAYSYIDNNLHAKNCFSCMYSRIEPHVFDAGNLTYCIACEHIVLGGGIGGVGGILAIQSAPLVSINGSCILSNGYVVLVEEDKEAYFNETLQFYPRGQVPQIS